MAHGSPSILTRAKLFALNVNPSVVSTLCSMTFRDNMSEYITRSRASRHPSGVGALPLVSLTSARGRAVGRSLIGLDPNHGHTR